MVQFLPRRQHIHQIINISQQRCKYYHANKAIHAVLFHQQVNPLKKMIQFPGLITAGAITLYILTIIQLHKPQVQGYESTSK